MTIKNSLIGTAEAKALTKNAIEKLGNYLLPHSL
jgi:hypothetical protein